MFQILASTNIGKLLLLGRLDVHWGSAEDGIPIWTRNGTTGYRWQQAQIPIYKPKIKTGVRHK